MALMSCNQSIYGRFLSQTTYFTTKVTKTTYSVVLLHPKGRPEAIKNLSLHTCGGAVGVVRILYYCGFLNCCTLLLFRAGGRFKLSKARSKLGQHYALNSTTPRSN
jgi:hypothetical protein